MNTLFVGFTSRDRRGEADNQFGIVAAQTAESAPPKGARAPAFVNPC